MTKTIARGALRAGGAHALCAVAAGFDTAHFIMETGVLHGLKTRVERQAALRRPGRSLSSVPVEAEGVSAATRADVRVEVPSEGAAAHDLPDIHDSSTRPGASARRRIDHSPMPAKGAYS